MPATSPTRHAVARSTGATTLAIKQDDGSWAVDCLNHGGAITIPSRGVAWKTASHPQDWCPKCKSIAAGKTKKIEDGLLPAPTKPTVKKAATNKATPTTNRPLARPPRPPPRTAAQPMLSHRRRSER